MAKPAKVGKLTGTGLDFNDVSGYRGALPAYKALLSACPVLAELCANVWGSRSVWYRRIANTNLKRIAETKPILCIREMM